jgi:hypothetical protein
MLAPAFHPLLAGFVSRVLPRSPLAKRLKRQRLIKLLSELDRHRALRHRVRLPG